MFAKVENIGVVKVRVFNNTPEDIACIISLVKLSGLRLKEHTLFSDDDIPISWISSEAKLVVPTRDGDKQVPLGACVALSGDNILILEKDKLKLI